MQNGQWKVKLLNKNCRTKINRIKIGGDPQTLGGKYPPSVSAKGSQWNKNCGTKTSGIKISGIKISRIKIGRDLQILGGGAPKCNT